MFKVITFNADATRSIYRIDGTKKTCSYSDLLIHLAAASGSNIAIMSDADKKPLIDQINATNAAAKPNEAQQAYADLITKIEEHLPQHQSCLNAEMVEGFKQFISWTADDKGNVVFLARTPSAGNTWTIVDNVVSYITANKINGVSIQEELSKAYFRTRLAGKSGPTMYQTIDDNDGSWSAPISKARLYWAGFKRLMDIDPDAVDKDAAIAAIKWMDDRETKLAPFTEVFTTGPTGWLYQQWLKSSLATIDMPTTMTNDPTVAAFSYINLGLECAGESPDFDGWLESLPDICREPFCAILYASLNDKIDRIPLVTWLHGEGNDGKSALLGSLGAMFGDSLVGAVSASVATSEFGAETLLGKRLIVLGDAQTGNILNTNLLHAITGGDQYVVNRKNEKHINHTFKSIVWIGANTPPNINLYNRNEARRIFYVPMHEPSEATMRKYCVCDEQGHIKRYATGMPVYNGYNLKAGLIREMAAIMYKCRVAFEKMAAGTHNTIILPDACFNMMLDRCGSDEMDVLADFFVDGIVLDKSATADVLELNRAYLIHAHGPHAANDLSKYSFELAKVKRYIKTSYGIEASQRTINGSRKRVYAGLRLNMGFEAPTAAVANWSRPAQQAAMESIL